MIEHIPLYKRATNIESQVEYENIIVIQNI
jgi:hypothetical protein